MTIRPNSGNRRSYGIVAQLAKQGYRVDLRKVNLFAHFFCESVLSSFSFTFLSLASTLEPTLPLSILRGGMKGWAWTCMQ